MILVLHPKQVQEVLDLAADLGLSPEDVLAEMYGAGVVVTPSPTRPSPKRPADHRRIATGAGTR